MAFEGPVRILLIEDDVIIARSLKAALQKVGYAVDAADNGEDGLHAAEIGEYDAVVLDLMLPKRDGWNVCQELRRQRNNVPILMLTARDAVDDRVRGLDVGADDYLPKPFDVRELVARIRALLRREKVHKGDRIEIADLVIDSSAHSVRRAGKEIKLTPREFSLLEALARNEGRTLTRDVILEDVWNGAESYPNTVNFHVTLLRKKVDAGFKPKLIHTVHGIGYVLRVEP